MFLNLLTFFEKFVPKSSNLPPYRNIDEADYKANRRLSTIPGGYNCTNCVNYKNVLGWELCKLVEDMPGDKTWVASEDWICDHFELNPSK